MDQLTGATPADAYPVAVRTKRGEIAVGLMSGQLVTWGTHEEQVVTLRDVTAIAQMYVNDGISSLGEADELSFRSLVMLPDFDRRSAVRDGKNASFMVANSQHSPFVTLHGVVAIVGLTDEQWQNWAPKGAEP